jgi:PPE-repeat protein
MSFLTSPPEIISSLLYSGPGAAPMLAAAASWDGLATELGSAAQSFSSVTSGLAGQAWQGPASAAMTQTAARYASYLTQAATQAQAASAQAQAVASAFESTMAASVHPAFVAANRNGLVQLVVSNLFGQNAPAIAAVEADYEQMWARDVAAMVGYHGGASAAAAQLPSWAEAVGGLPAQATAAIAGNPVAAALTSAASAASGNPITDLLGPVGQDVAQFGAQIQHQAINVINAPTDLLLGRQIIPTGPQATGGSATINPGGTTATAPLTMVGGTEPIVNASVGSGSTVPLLVDTGSTGLVIPFTKVGGLLGVLQLGIPRGIGIGGYSGGLDYLYATYNAPVNFGGGLVTASTPVNVEFLAFPASLQSAMTNGLTFQSFFATDGAAGVLGVGPNAGGPGPSIPTQALASPFNHGLLINEATASPYLQFGDAPTAGAPLTHRDGSQYVPVTTSHTVTGAPITTLDVSVNGATPQPISSIVDSGGVEGTLPSTLNVPSGATVTVYAPNDSTPLYSFKNGMDYFPTPTTGLMNTGNLPYQVSPVYIDYGANTLTFYQ